MEEIATFFYISSLWFWFWSSKIYYTKIDFGEIGLNGTVVIPCMLSKRHIFLPFLAKDLNHLEYSKLNSSLNFFGALSTAIAILFDRVLPKFF